MIECSYCGFWGFQYELNGYRCPVCGNKLKHRSVKVENIKYIYDNYKFQQEGEKCV